MPKQEIIVKIDADANVTVEAKGIKGSGCLQATEAIEKALGTATDRRKTSEYHQKATLGQQAKQT